MRRPRWTLVVLARASLGRYHWAMPNHPSFPKRFRDVNERAALIEAEATDEVAPTTESAKAVPKPKPTDDKRSPAILAFGRLGGLTGGKARAAKLTVVGRSAQAKRAAASRWAHGH